MKDLLKTNRVKPEKKKRQPVQPKSGRNKPQQPQASAHEPIVQNKTNKKTPRQQTQSHVPTPPEHHQQVSPAIAAPTTTQEPVVATTQNVAKNVYDDDTFSKNYPPEWSTLQEIYNEHGVEQLYEYIQAFFSFYAIHANDMNKSLHQHQYQNRLMNVTKAGPFITHHRFRLFNERLFYLVNNVPLCLIPDYIDKIVGKETFNNIKTVLEQQPEYQVMKFAKETRKPKRYLYPDIPKSSTTIGTTNRQNTKTDIGGRTKPLHYVPQQLQRKTTTELSAMLSQHGIDVGDDWTRQDMIDKLLKILVNDKVSYSHFKYKRHYLDKLKEVDLATLMLSNGFSDLRDLDKTEMIMILSRIINPNYVDRHYEGDRFTTDCERFYNKAPWIRQEQIDQVFNGEEGGKVVGIAVKSGNIFQTDNEIQTGWYRASSSWFDWACEKGLKGRKFHEGEVGYICKSKNGRRVVLPEDINIYQDMKNYNESTINSTGMVRSYRTGRYQAPPPRDPNNVPSTITRSSSQVEIPVPTADESKTTTKTGNEIIAPGLMNRLAHFLTDTKNESCFKCTRRITLARRHDKVRAIRRTGAEDGRIISFCSDECFNQYNINDDD